MPITHKFQTIQDQCINIFTIVVFCVILPSCKKKDDVLPTLSIQEPGLQEVFNYGENIPIHVTASDNNSLEYIKVEITNSESLPVLNSLLNSNPGDNSAELEGSIPFDDVHLNSGTYYVRATAYDGENLKTAFREIILQGAPLLLDKILLVKNITDGLTEIDSLDTEGNWQNVTSASLTYDVGIENPYHQYITLTGKDYEGIESVDTEFFVSLSHIDTPWLSSDYFEDIYYDPFTYRVFIGAKDGSITSLAQNGFQYSKWSVASNFSPKKILVTTDYIYTFEISTNELQKTISVYSKISGILLQSAAVSGEMIDLVLHDSQDEILLVMNNASESDFKLYDRPSNSITDLDFISSINPDPAIKAESKNPNAIFVAHESVIQLYNNLQASGAGFAGLDVINMKYDPVNNVLYVLTNDALHILNSNATAELNSFPVPAGAVDFLLIYNK